MPATRLFFLFYFSTRMNLTTNPHLSALWIPNFLVTETGLFFMNFSKRNFFLVKLNRFVKVFTCLLQVRNQELFKKGKVS